MTYAIFAIGSRQFRAEPGKTLKIPKLAAEPGSTVTFDRVLLATDGTQVQAGAPVVQGAKVTAEVVRHGLGEKIRFTGSRAAPDSGGTPDTASRSPRSRSPT